MPTRMTGTRQALGAIGVLLALGLALRLIIAYVLLPGAGFGVDRGTFQFWAADLAANGPLGFYDRGFFVDYTPGYLYVLWLVGLVGQPFGGPGELIKLPPILADVASAWVVHRMVRELGASERSALVGAGIVLFNPVVWFDSAIWGQVDSVGTFVVLLALRELWHGRPERATLLGTVAAIIKPQFGIFIPLAAAVLLKRHVVDPWLARRRADAEPRSEPPLEGAIRILSSATVGLVAASLICLPFGLTIVGLVAQVAETAGGYPYVTVNAFNPWALVTFEGGGLAESGTWIRDIAGPGPGEMGLLIGPVPAVVVGAALILLAIAAVSFVAAVRDDRWTLVIALTVIAIAFFVLPTRVHERYVFPALVLGAILAATIRPWRIAYVVLSIASFLNLYAVLTNPFYENPGISDWLGIAEWSRTWPAVAAAAVAHLGVLAWAAWQLRPGAAPSIAAPVEGATAGTVGDAVTATSAGIPTAPQARPALSAARPPDPEATPARWAGYPSPDDVGIWAEFRRRVLARPTRADRSRALHGEPGGRFDRLDALVVGVLLVGLLVLRTFRLGEPHGMHFDEVYHARTATEFLQHWRYGEPHAIYEYTHPHLAKYAIAAGLVVAGGDRITGRSELGVPVRDATIESRAFDPSLPEARAGDRLYVATGTDVRVYDLRDRDLVVTLPIPDATAVALDGTPGTVGRTLYVGTAVGDVLALPTQAGLDPVREGLDPVETAIPVAVGRIDGPIERLHATVDGHHLVALVGDQAVTLDATTGETIGRVGLAAPSAIADGGTSEVLVARPAAVADAAAAAVRLADLLGLPATDLEADLRSGAERVVLGGALAAETRTAVQAAIDEGGLAGIAFESVPRVALADESGVTFLDPAGGTVVDSLDLDEPATGLARLDGVDDPRLYVAAGGEVAVVALGKSAGGAPVVKTHVMMPGRVERVTVDPASRLVHVLGWAPQGGGRTIYVIEPHANAVFADAPLPFEPVSWATDVATDYPGADRQQLLVFGDDGATAAVDIGSHQFAWRLPGVLAGVLTAALVYALARLLFRRRAVALLAAVFVALDGMFFVQSRIAMNDSFVTLFIVAAYVVFAALWTGAWRWRYAYWVGLPIVGGLLGLALASKWVAAYAIGGIAVLMLARSALGRLVVVLGLATATGVLGYMSITVVDGAKSAGNGFFALLMVGLTLTAVVVSVLRPIAWSLEEVRFAVGAPVVVGALVGLASVPLGLGSTGILVGLACFGLGVLAYAGFRATAAFGFGPLALPPAADDPGALVEPPAPPPSGWLRLGSSGGVPVAWAGLSLLVIPLAIYVVSYLPWVALGNRLVDGWPAGATGQTLLELTRSMYDYHDNLRATHAASSPWWAWPFDLKPVWFYQGGFAGDTSAAIYDGGNLAIWWLAIPAMAFAALQAWRRRSLALALVVLAFAFQWLPWTRIDRATFQYHYYASLPFLVIGLAYFVAELWHGASARTWLLAKVAAAVAVLGPPLLWLFRGPFCALARVSEVNAGAQTCSNYLVDVVVTERTAGLVVVLGLAVVLLLAQLFRPPAPDPEDPTASWRWLGRLGLTALVAIVGLAFARLVLGETPLLNLAGLRIELLGLVVLAVIAPVALFMLFARDARRFVQGLLVAVAAVFVIFYPNWSALPLPSNIFNAYQGLLPSWTYPFQFAVNTDPAPSGSPFQPLMLVLLGGVLVVSGVVAYSAASWRVALAEQRADRADATRAGGGPVATAREA